MQILNAWFYLFLVLGTGLWAVGVRVRLNPENLPVSCACMLRDMHRCALPVLYAKRAPLNSGPQKIALTCAKSKSIGRTPCSFIPHLCQRF